MGAICDPTLDWSTGKHWKLHRLLSKMIDRGREINRGRLDIAVPHKLRETEKVTPALQHQRGIRMPKHVRSKLNPTARTDPLYCSSEYPFR